MDNILLKLIDLFNDKFDAIYCIHYLPYKERLPKCIDELKRVGIYYHRNFKFIYDIDSPLFRILYNNLPNHSNNEKFNAFKITLKHYKCYKEAYYLNFNRILILEDDSVFLNYLDDIYNIISNTPDNDICLYDWIPYNPGTNPSDGNMFFKFDKLWAASCYSVNTNFYKYLIDKLESTLFADGIDAFFNINDLDFIKIASTKQVSILNNFIADRSHLGALNDLFYNSINLNRNLYNI